MHLAGGDEVDVCSRSYKHETVQEMGSELISCWIDLTLSLQKLSVDKYNERIRLAME